MPDLYLDLTEWLSRPIRTGIQRVEGELVQWWPGNVPFRVARFDPLRGMLVLPEGAEKGLRQLFTASEMELDRVVADLRRAGSSPDVKRLNIDDGATRLVVPEVFFDQQRISYYCSLTPRQLSRTYVLVYDLLPLTHPSYFGPTVRPEVTGAYYRMVRMAPRVGFISKATRSAYFQRLRRSVASDGPAFYLGSDGLGPRPPMTPVPCAPVFSVIGTVEPRKNHAAVLEAFLAFRKERPDAQLRFYGRWGWCEPELRALINSMNGRDDFQFVENPADGEIRQGILESTATIYASAAEGFGLPAIESLWLGTPVIATRHIPSLENLGELGILFVDSIDWPSLATAMRRVSLNATSQALRDQARRLDLPTWKSFAEEFSRWVWN